MKNASHGLPRRSFLKNGLVGLAGLGAASAPFAAASGRPQETKKTKGVITRTLGRTGLVLPVVSMGVMNADNENLVRAALDGGIILLDTANGYQRGRNEEMIGRMIKGRPRDSYVIATKARGDAATFPQLVDISLQRLGLDHVDILYVHGVGAKADALSESNLRSVENAKKSGKARFIGMSTHSHEAEVLRAAVEAKIYDVVLTSYNFKRTDIADLQAAIAEAAGAGIGIVAMKTQAGAFWDKERKDPINMKAALKWALSNPNITTAIPGFTTFDQLEADLTVMNDLTLTDAERKDLRLGTQTGGLYCQQCEVCLPQCPKALPIPSLMRGYMYAYGYRNLEAARGLVASLDVPVNPCGECGECRVRCASAFDVRDRVTDIARIRNIPEDFLG